MSVQKSQTEENENLILNQQLIVFKLGGEEYALTIEQVKEVVITPTVTKIPHTPPYIKGIGNVRGNIIAVVDLEDKFNMDKDPNWEGNYTLVVESAKYKVGVLSGQVPDTLAVADSQIDKSMTFGGESAGLDSNYIQGIVKLDKRLIILIDIFKILNEEEIAEAVN